jgi:ribosome-binding ATPase YchF (GTP1/OBG family)
MKIGLAGYSGSGITTLLALLSEDPELAGKHGGPEIRSITVDDPRLDQLVTLFQPKKATSLQLEIVELGDLRPQEGGGLRKETLTRAAGLDALVLVLRGFVAPMSSQYRPEKELAEELNSLMQEFCLSDLVPIENRLEKLEKEGKVSSREAQLLIRLREKLEEGRPIRLMDLDKEELRVLSGYQFLTLAPLMVIANLGADAQTSGQYPEMTERCVEEGVGYLEIRALSELEIVEIPEGERGLFLEDLGIDTLSGDRFVHALFRLLGLITFFTVGDKEVRAWSVVGGTPAVKAAGKVHTDMERGFIRAEVISVAECVELGGLSKARDAGKLRVEGKEYVLKDGEVFHVRFNV